ncbi:MAG: 4-(cytidine 5'-diphospho)-2-C-methyl-D-erythritol kinase [Candidatus Cloacimonetes bacterium]|nr:4-(cytidine 5'-diphospho)-2-C-methyl-D-erythritol kinase [Candidatus Cloacimonadota bacterium]
MIPFKSPAKINVGLFVFPKRNDGYHPLDTTFFGINLFDTLHIEKSNSFGLSCSSSKIPTDHKNIIHKTWSLFSNQVNNATPLKIHLEKDLPSEAGIGGASGNAAITLWLLNEIHGRPFNIEQLESMALSIGADVPFFLQNEPCFASGIGEIFSPIKDHQTLHLVLIKPTFSIKTGPAFHFLDSVTRNTSNIPHQKFSSILRTGNLSSLTQLVSNDFELIPGESEEQISQIKHKLYQNNASYASLSGSGSCIYGLFESKTKAKLAFDVLNKSYETYLCETLLNHSPLALNKSSLAQIISSL